jgi:hypothetical protein
VILAVARHKIDTLSIQITLYCTLLDDGNLPTFSGPLALQMNWVRLATSSKRLAVRQTYYDCLRETTPNWTLTQYSYPFTPRGDLPLLKQLLVDCALQAPAVTDCKTVFANHCVELIQREGLTNALRRPLLPARINTQTPLREYNGFCG